MKIIAAVVALPLIAHADPRLDLPEPESPPPVVIREDTPSPVYYRLPPDTVKLAIRDGLGVAIRDGGAFAADVSAGAAVRFGRGSSMGAWIEAGYSYDRFHDHLATLGAGPALYHVERDAIDDGSLRVAIIPHVVAGSVDGSFGYGVRTSVIASFWLYGIELAHQYLVPQGIHEVRVMFTAPMVLGS